MNLLYGRKMHKSQNSLSIESAPFKIKALDFFNIVSSITIKRDVHGQGLTKKDFSFCPPPRGEAPGPKDAAVVVIFDEKNIKKNLKTEQIVDNLRVEIVK